MKLLEEEKTRQQLSNEILYQKVRPRIFISLNAMLHEIYNDRTKYSFGT